MTKTISNWNTKQMILASIAIFLITTSSSVGIAIWLSQLPSQDRSPPDSPNTTDPTQDEIEQNFERPYSSLENFSFYTDYETDYEVDAPQYDINADLSNVLNVEQFLSLDGWSTEVEDLISQNYFAAVQNCTYHLASPDRPYYQFSEVYDENYWEEIPSFVTVDSMYHVFHVLYDHALRTMEQDNFTTYVEVLVDHLLENSIQILRDAEDSHSLSHLSYLHLTHADLRIFNFIQELAHVHRHSSRITVVWTVSIAMQRAYIPTENDRPKQQFGY